MKSIRRHSKKIVALLVVLFISQVVETPVAFAITGHDSMPEYRSFEPVSTTNMVNPFTGDFTYNIPLMNVPNGYPINLSYHSSAVNNEAQSSWVGLGWTLNPGAINRSKRGFPDEFNGAEVTYHNRTEPNWTVSGNYALSKEFFSIEKNQGSDKKDLFGVSFGTTLAFNNYTGFSRTRELGIHDPRGISNLSISYANGRFGFSPSINPMAIVSSINQRSISSNAENNNQASSKVDAPKSSAKRTMRNFLKQTARSVGYNFLTSIRIGLPSQPSGFAVNSTRYTGRNISLKTDIGPNALNVPVEFGEFTVGGNFAIKNFEEDRKLKVYGYMYNESADENSMMDYTTEKDQMYEKRDRYLGIPIANNDVFMMTGQSLGGSFRAYRSELGHYHKNATENHLTSESISADIAQPISPTPWALWSVGGDVMSVSQNTILSDWTEENRNKGSYSEFTNGESLKRKSNEKFVLRFTGERASNFDQTGDSDAAMRARLEGKEFGVDIGNYSYAVSKAATLDLEIPASLHHGDYNGQAQSLLEERQVRSKHISMHTNQDLGDENKVLVNGADVAYLAEGHGVYFLQNGVAQPLQLSAEEATSIGEVATYSELGEQYIYGLPLLAKNEKSLSYSLKSGEFEFIDGDGMVVRSTNSKLDEEAKRKMGYESATPYASQLLLTQISSPDYVDRTYNGPTPDDFGAYTRFNYEKFTTDDDFYAYKSPYEGLSFDLGSLSDKKDNMGSFSYGEKELYYLNTVVSKTHIAVFTTSDRHDGIGVTASNSAQIILNDQTDGHHLRKLDRIDLYSLKDCELHLDDQGNEVPGMFKPKEGAVAIQTVHFDYNYELCKNLPNNSQNEGKLTLKHLWFEYNGVKSTKISPYTFHYNYPREGDGQDVVFPAVYQDASKNIANYGVHYQDAQAQQDLENPDYSVVNTSRWGAYRHYQSLKDKLGDLARFFPFTNQDPDDSKYDPAAHCLKRIELPSGGQILVQYEQHDYTHVQNKPAMMMVPLSSNTEIGVDNGAKKKYYLDLNKVGVDQINMSVLNQLFLPFVNGERLYFNFLYALTGLSPVDYRELRSEYIEGYARIGGYGIKDGKAFFVFKHDQTHGAEEYTEVQGDFERKEIPSKICKEYYNNMRSGLVSKQSNGLGNPEDDNVLKNLLRQYIQILGVEQKCKRMSPTMSYVRLALPALKSKKAEGCRVKRLLMYDQSGASSRSAVLYGNEYEYTREVTRGAGDAITVSSGVATFEPALGRRENSLVYPLDRNEQSKLEAILYGRDIQKQEGPLGENLYPAPSIGYEKVTVRNIHNGATGSGYTVHRYLTCKQFPMQRDVKPMEQIGGDQIGTGNLLNLNIGHSVGIQYSLQDVSLSQGYAFVFNEMHGQPLSVEHFAEGSETPQSGTYYEYFDYKEKVPVMNADGTVTSDYLGKVSELFAESREIQDYEDGGSVSFDFSPGYQDLPPPAYPAKVPLFFGSYVRGTKIKREKRMRSHVMTKLISYPAVVHKTRSLSPDGVEHITENLIFDRQMGTPIVTRSYDDFDAVYTNINSRASWHYPEMGAKSVNEGMETDALFRKSGATSYYLDFNFDNAECDALDKFYRGDLIRVSIDDAPYLFYVDEVDRLHNLVRMENTVFVNESLPPYSGVVAPIKVIKSGRTNQLTVSDGSITLHKAISTEDFESISTDKRTASHPFTDDLNAELDEVVTSAAISSQPIVLNGPYTGLNLANLGTGQSLCENADPDLKISDINLQLYYDVGAQELIMHLTEYKILDDNGTELQHVVCDDPGLQTDHFSVSLSNNYNCNGVAVPADHNPSSQDESGLQAILRYAEYDASPQVDCQTNPIDWPTGNLQEIRVQAQGGASIDLNKSWPHLNLTAIRGTQLLQNIRCGQVAVFDGNNNRWANQEQVISSSGNVPEINTCQPVEYLDLFNNPRYGLNSFEFEVHAGSDAADCDGGDEEIAKAYFCLQPPNLNFQNSYEDVICNKTSGSISKTIYVNLQGYETDFYGNSGPLKSVLWEDGYNWIHAPGTNWDRTNPWSATSNSPEIANPVVEVIPGHEFEQATFTYPGAGIYTINYHAVEQNFGQTLNAQFQVEVLECENYECQCESVFPADQSNMLNIINGQKFTDVVGKFYNDLETGTLYYKQHSCPKQTIFECIQTCSAAVSVTAGQGFERVIAATASTFTDNWDYDDDNYPLADASLDVNDFSNYERGKKGHWRSKQSYVYRSEINESRVEDYAEYRNYNDGTFSMKLFNWRDQNLNDSKWLLTATVDSYTPNGQPAQDHNILNIYSAAKYAENGTQLSMVAQNAQEDQVMFQHFEQLYDSKYFDDGLAYDAAAATWTQQRAHTGKSSVLLKSGARFDVGSINAAAGSQKMMMRLWASNDKGVDALNRVLQLVESDVQESTNAHYYYPKRIASSGHWQLYEFEFTHSRDSKFEIVAKEGFKGKVFLDDLRIQPYEAEAVCYVYDEAQRLIAQFDDQHFASLFEYNAEGALIRKSKETTRGIKTISETEYNSRGQYRNDFVNELND